jgi:hypothetical protein
MKDKFWRDRIRKRLALHKQECLNCLNPEPYHWGCGSRRAVARTLALLNTILKGIPEEAWPRKDPNNEYVETVIAHNNWRIKLLWEYDSRGRGRRMADLKYRHNDHTAWVIERKQKDGVFINFDIGGS